VKINNSPKPAYVRIEPTSPLKIPAILSVQLVLHVSSVLQNYITLFLFYFIFTANLNLLDFTLFISKFLYSIQNFKRFLLNYSYFEPSLLIFIR